MKNLILLLLIFCAAISAMAQDRPKNFRIGLSTKLDKNYSSENVAFDQYTGYFAEYDKTNYRLGLNLEYRLKKGFTLHSAISYSNKDFTGTYYCAVCYFDVAPGPENINFRFLEIPLSVRYYFLPYRLKMFGEAGVNNQILSGKGIIDKPYALGMKLGGGIEYNFSRGVAIQLLVNYNKGITNLFNESDFKIDYGGFGLGLMKSL